MSKSLKIATHNGDFHADDVFSIALLKLIYPDADVIRSRDENILGACDIVVDVGGVYDPKVGRFDHHQRGFAEKHENGILRCGFGLVWKQFGQEFTKSEYIKNRIDNSLVATIDALDNGQQIVKDYYLETNIHTISDYFINLNPVGSDLKLEDYDQEFFKAVSFAQQYLQILKNKYQIEEKDSLKFLEYYQIAKDKRFVVLEEKLDYKYQAMQQSELLFVIGPRDDGSWGILALSQSDAQPFKLRKPFTVAWRSLKNEELANITNVDDAIFCHTTGFFAVATSKEGATQLVQKSLAVKNSGPLQHLSWCP